MTPRRSPLRFGTIVNTLDRTQPPRTGTPETVMARTAQAESAGFDVLAVADFAMSDPAPALTLVAEHSRRAAIATRVMGVYTRSPVQFASLAAWLHRLSGGRFELGIGASLPIYTTGVFGIPAGREASRTADTLKLYRALFGEEVPGVRANGDGSFRFEGETLSVERARLDLVTSRPPVHVAAVGPRMLELAGAWADGVILEYASRGYLQWALDRIREGAASTGRSLSAFEVTLETPVMTATEDPELVRRQRSWMQGYRWHVASDVWRPLWAPAGLDAVAARARAALEAGDEERADRILESELIPEVAPFGPEPFRAVVGWCRSRQEFGATTLALPFEVARFIGRSLGELRHAVASGTAATGGPVR